MKFRVMLGAMLAATTSSVDAQPMSAAPAFDVAARIWAVNGSTLTGNGGGAGLDVRWNSRRVSWLSLSSAFGATYFGAVSLPAELPIERSGFRADASAAFAELGPEAHVDIRRSRVYGAAWIGLAVINSNSTFQPFDTSYDWDHVNDLTWVTAVGGGIRHPITARLVLDLGVRRERTGAIVWARNPQGSFEAGPPLPPIEYRRRLSANSVHIGLRFVR